MSSSYLALGYKCNHNCKCCPLTTRDKLHKALTYSEIESIADLITPEDTYRHIVLSGGEPMLHPDFFKILELLSSKNFNITVLSNSSQCKNIDFVKKIKSIVSVDKFDIVTAIHSNIPSVHDEITGMDGSLLETLEGIDNIVSENIPITIKHIFNKMSLETLFTTFEYLERHYPPQVRFQFCSMDYSGQANKNIKSLFVTMEEIKPHIEKLLDYLETRMSKNRHISIIETPLCLTDPYYWKYFSVNSSTLDAYIAPNNEDTLMANEVSSDCGAFFEACEKCLVKKWCSGTWVSAYKYGKNGLLNPFLN